MTGESLEVAVADILRIDRLAAIWCHARANCSERSGPAWLFGFQKPPIMHLAVATRYRQTPTPFDLASVPHVPKVGRGWDWNQAN